ncbi:MAG: DUF423 domain-containing protein [Chitinophagaceae bacterium]|jgi:uncharacterized membrane protein YgdD (TMEM256/DUF423 family)|nr:DUF423 domain-containing protein [Chitinophagaceae bacterium]
MHKGFIKTAILLGALSVALGAFAAHALKQQVSDHAVNIFETGVRYQFYHVFALLAAGILYKEFPNRFISWAGILFIAGIILFSGSLYWLMYIKGAVTPGYNWVGAITPLGGVAFILGWIFLFIGCFKKS